jgi:hypothetical protein
MAKKLKSEIPVPFLSYSEVEGMAQADRITRFRIEASAGQRAFSAMGKLFRAIESGLTKKDKGIFPLLIAAGIKKGTISNASYAAKVFDLVEAGQLKEDEYDQLSHADCFNICRVQTAKSRKKLSVEEVVAVIRAGGEPDEELASIYEHGVTSAERAEAEAKVAAAKEKAEADAKARAEAEAEELARVKAENEALKAEAAAQAASATTDPEIADANAGHPAPESPSKELAEVVAQLDEPLGEDADPVGITAADVLATLDEVELAFADLSPDDQAIVAARIIELAGQLAESGITPSPKGVKKGKKAVA